jgi:hypothetical protein
MRESTAYEISMSRKLWADAKDLEKRFKSNLSSIKCETARKAATTKGMTSSAPVREIPGTDTSADAKRHFESGDPVYFQIDGGYQFESLCFPASSDMFME